jgi:hypothetical protein
VVRVGAWPLDPAHRTLRAAVHAFGAPGEPGCTPVSVPGGTGYIEAEWPAIGVSAEFHSSGSASPGGMVCGFPGNASLVSISLHGDRWQLANGLRVGMPQSAIKRYAPGATRHTAPFGTFWELWFAWAHYQSFDGWAPALAANIDHGRISELTANLFERDRYQRYAGAGHR